ncbi:MAG: hypothetical protein M1820_005215 [Bogoriella megaspora]|nr:MAG: hypothetical protein M1820_005215 [Bogoriella megaspora]
MAGPEFQTLKEVASIVYDDRPPDEDGHTMWGVDHGTGAVVAVRPDLWVGRTVRPDQGDILDAYFSGFLNSQVIKKMIGVNGVDGVSGINGVNGANGHTHTLDAL